MVTFDEIIYLMVIASTKITNTASTNVSINSGDKNVRYKIDCYIFHSFISGHVSIDNYYYLPSLCKI